MDNTQYIEEVKRTYAGADEVQVKLTLAALGLTGESGEVADAIKKMLFQGHALDRKHVAKELGDILWYLGLACEAIGYSLDEVMQMNVDKLRARYPQGFDPERSINRERYEQSE